MIHHLALQNSILNQFLSEIRDKDIQKDSLRFRRNLERIGEVAAYEISKVLPFLTAAFISANAVFSSLLFPPV